MCIYLPSFTCTNCFHPLNATGVTKCRQMTLPVSALGAKTPESGQQLAMLGASRWSCRGGRVTQQGLRGGNAEGGRGWNITTRSKP